MSRPTRWIESHDAPIGVRELLSAARPTRAIDDARRERGAARVAKLGAAPVAAAAVSTWVKLAAAAGIGLATTTAVVATRSFASHDAEVAPREVIAPAIVARSPSPKIAPRDEVPAPEPPPAIVSKTEEPPAIAIPPAPRSVAPPKIEIPIPVAEPAPVVEAPLVAEAKSEKSEKKPSTLADELVVIESARAHVARDPSTTLARAAEHRARWPHGVLGAERDLIELDALRRVGREDDARARAAAWLSRDPSGPYASRLRAIASAAEHHD
jgi:hypothetical protein